MRAVILLVGLGILGASQGAIAQETPACQRAVDAVLAGKVTAARDSAWDVVTYRCSVNVRIGTFVSFIRTHRRMTIEQASRTIGPLAVLRDGQLFAEVLSIAADPSASIPARVKAFMTLSALKNPNWVARYSGFTSGLSEHGFPNGMCHLRSTHPQVSEPGPVSLPADFLEQIKDVKRTVYYDTSQPDAIRSAAACA